MKGLFALTLLFHIIFLCHLSCDSIPVSYTVSGEIIEEERMAGEFDAINVSSGIDLIIKQGEKEKIIVRADESVLEKVETKVEEGVLKIYCNRTLMRYGTIQVIVTVKKLTYLSASAGSDVEGEGTLSFPELKIEISSGSDLELSVKTGVLELEASSGSDAKLSGSTDSFSAMASSGSDIKAGELVSENVKVNCSSGSDVHLTANQSVEVKASGGSDVFIKGNPPKQNISSTGGSDVHFE